MIRIKEYRKANSLEEAWELNQKRSNRVIGGMLFMKMSHADVNTAIDLSGLGLDQIEEDEEEFRIGCMVSLRQMEMHEGLNDYTDHAVKEALRHIVGVQFRNLATVGGSVFGRFGFSDVLTLLLALDSYVELYNGGLVPMETFASMERDNDILVRIIIKKVPVHAAYQSVRNTATDFPVLACAGAVVGNEVRLSVGARPAKAVLIRDEERILSAGINKETTKRFAEYAAKRIPTGSNMRGSAAYRQHLVRVLTERVLTELGGGQDAG